MNHFHRVLILSLILCVSCTQAQTTKIESDRERDGFVGPVKRVFVVWSPISGSNYLVLSLFPDRVGTKSPRRTFASQNNLRNTARGGTSTST